MPVITKSSTKQRRKNERKMEEERILLLAEAIFKNKGYPSTTMEEIANAAGVALGTIYNYFRTKDILYASIVEKLAAQMLFKLTSEILPEEDSETALKKLIEFRISDFDKQMLFFILFSFERATGMYPEPENLLKGLQSSYYRYLDILAQIFEKGIRKGLWEPEKPLYMALTFEGAINAFMGYLWKPGSHLKSEIMNDNNFKSHIVHMFRRKKQNLRNTDAKKNISPNRNIYITRFDFERLKELIKVTRLFSKPELIKHVEALDRELTKGVVIVDSKSIPADVVTMNSRFLLKKLAAGKTMEKTIVFPVDAEKEKSNLSILDPLGTAVFGRTEGNIFNCTSENGNCSYSLEKILYQPEAAGDYHL